MGEHNTSLCRPFGGSSGLAATPPSFCCNDYVVPCDTNKGYHSFYGRVPAPRLWETYDTPMHCIKHEFCLLLVNLLGNILLKFSCENYLGISMISTIMYHLLHATHEHTSTRCHWMCVTHAVGVTAIDIYRAALTRSLIGGEDGADFCLGSTLSPKREFCPRNFSASSSISVVGVVIPH